MVQLHVSYEGELRCKATHGPSGNQLLTDAPVDNHGKGEQFSPTDLVATALGACMVTIMGIEARAKQIELTGMKVLVTKEMTQTKPRRIAKLSTRFTVPHHLASLIPEETRRYLEKAAENCPVRLSLSSDIQLPIEFNWE